MRIEPVSLKGYDLLHRGVQAFADLERRGIRIDTEFCERKRKHLQRQIERMERKIAESPEGKVWRKHYGSKTNFNSPTQLNHVLYNLLGLKKDEDSSTDRDSLEDLDLEMARHIVDYRRLQNICNKYLLAFTRDSLDGILHPSWNLHTVRTYRSSSSNPNFQNIPKRDAVAQEICRRAIIPRQDHMIMEADFSGIEVRIAACYNEDPVLIAYITDPTRDMHRDMCQKIYKLKDDQWTKLTRYSAKNGFVFPEFYGDYYAHCAMQLWKNIDKLNLTTRDGQNLREHLHDHGIHDYQQFERHVQNIEDEFWNERFKVYTKWKNKQISFYEKHGYVELFTGFRCSGIMKKNDVINYPIQGSAFHCLLWSLIHLNDEMKAQKYRSWIIGQIHDSINADVFPDEYNRIIKLFFQVTTEELAKTWKWIVVPLEIELEIATMNASWYEIKQVHPQKCDVCFARYMYKTDKSYECPLCGDVKEISNGIAA